MDQATLIIEAISFIFGLGIVWGSLNARIKQLERESIGHRDLAERLTRIEEKVKYIAEHIKNNQ